MLLALTLAVLQDSREHIRSQDAKISSLYGAIEPLVGSGSDTLRNVEPLIDEATSLAQEARPAVRSAPPLFDAGIATLNEAQRALSDGRASALIDSALQLLGRVSAEDLVGRAAGATETLEMVLAVQRRLLVLQRRAFAVQRHSLAVQRRSRRIQTRTLDHAESLDQKTGGDLSPVTP